MKLVADHRGCNARGKTGNSPVLKGAYVEILILSVLPPGKYGASAQVQAVSYSGGLVTSRVIRLRERPHRDESQDNVDFQGVDKRLV